MQSSTQTTASPNNSQSEQDAEAAIYAMQAKAWGIYRPGMTLPEIVAAITSERTRRTDADEARRLSLAAAAAEEDRKAFANTVAKRRTALAADGIPTDGMTDQAVLARYDAYAESRREAIRLEQAAGMQRQRTERLFAVSNCPKRHLRNLDTAGADSPEWAKVRDGLVSRLGDGEGYLVPLLGLRGTGKTQLAVSVIHRACARGMTARYVKALDLFRDIRGSFTPVKRGEAGESEADVIDTYAGYRVLVIDELHQRAETQFEQNTLVNLLDRRYDAMGYTILIANQDRKEFGDAMGDSVKSRIHETGEVIECKWAGFRMPGSWKLGGAA